MENDGNSLPQISDKNELVAKLTGTGQRSGSCIFYVYALPFRKKKKKNSDSLRWVIPYSHSWSDLDRSIEIEWLEIFEIKLNLKLN